MKNTQKKYMSFVLVGIFLAVSVWCYGSKRAALLDTVASYIAYPLLCANAYVVQPVKAWYDEREAASRYCQLLARARQEQERLLERVIALEGQLQFVQDIKELHQFAQQYDTSYACTVQVIAKIFSEQQHYFFIDAGSKKGIEPDMVAVYKNCLLGRITEVYPWYSKIVLITDRSCKVAACCSKTRAQGIHEGMQSVHESCLSFVNQLETLEVGDLVVSSGEGLVFPRGYGLGTIKEFSAHDLYYEVYVEPMVDFSTVMYCYIMKKGSVHYLSS